MAGEIGGLPLSGPRGRLARRASRRPGGHDDRWTRRCDRRCLAHRRATRSVRDLPAAERPRERLALRGPGGLSAAELIAVVLGTGGGGRSAMEVAEELARPPRGRRGARPGHGRASSPRSPGSAARRRRGSRPRSSWVGGPSRTGRPGAGRSGRRATSRAAAASEMGRLEREELRVLEPQREERRPARVDRLRRATCRRRWCGSGSCSATPSGSTRPGSCSSTTTRRGDPTPQPGRPPPHRRGDRRRAAAGRRRPRPRRDRPRRVGLAAGPRRGVRPDRARAAEVASRRRWGCAAGARRLAAGGDRRPAAGSRSAPRWAAAGPPATVNGRRPDRLAHAGRGGRSACRW